MPVPRYAKSGDVHIAYMTTGEGPIDLVWVPTWISQCEHIWDEPAVAAALERLATFSRVIVFDRRGSGLSDPWQRPPTLEEQMDDLLAVMRAEGSERAAVAGSAEGGALAATFAATHPDRTSALVLYAAIPRPTWAPDYDWAWTAEQRAGEVAHMAESWGEGHTVRKVAPLRFERDAAFRAWAGKLERLALSPGMVSRAFEVSGATDIRGVLPSIRVPTLVMHRRDDSFVRIEHSRYAAHCIPGARFVELEGSESLFAIGDAEAMIGEIEEFVTGERHQPAPDRVLATVLFTDIVSSTERAAALGDRSWRELLERHDALMRGALARHRGREVKRTGDGFLATFDGPARAISCATRAAAEMRALGIEIRAGLHTGECEVIGDDVGGLAVHIGARVMSCAGPGEVVVSSTVKDLVVGSGIECEERGAHGLKGVPGEWHLFSVG